MGQPDTWVTIHGTGLQNVSSVLFGNLPAGFTLNKDGTITAYAPMGGQAGSTVPVTGLDNSGNYVPTSAFYWYPMGEMDVTGPLPFFLNGIQTQIGNNGTGHDISAYPAQQLLYPVAKPVFHVSVSLNDDTPSQPTPQPSFALLGNQGTFGANLQMCSLTGVPAFGISDTGQPCTNWDNNTGTWVNLPPTQVTLSSSGPGQVTYGDVAVDTSAAFDQQNYARVFRLVIGGSLIDTNNGVADTDRGMGQTSSAFTVVITPEAWMQLDVVPYTIMYRPPGDQSTVKFTTGAAYATNFSLSDSTQNTNTNTTTTSDPFNFKEVVGIFTAGDSGSLDQSVLSGFGNSTQSGSTSSSSMAISGTWSKLADVSLIPGSGDTCAAPTDCSQVKHDANIYTQEPFWDDLFILLVHAQFAVYVLGGGQDRYVMYGAVPVTANITVTELAACAKGQALHGQNPCEIDYTDSGCRLR